MPFPAADNLLLIVVGSDLRAEAADRPLAYRLQQRIDAWLNRHTGEMNIDVEPAVCTDLWYMNHESLQQRPTISIGDPQVNALSDFFAQSADTAGEDDAQPQVVIQLDPEFTDLRVCIWGLDEELTAQGLDVFCRDYLADYLTAVVNQVEPKID